MVTVYMNIEHFNLPKKSRNCWAPNLRKNVFIKNVFFSFYALYFLLVVTQNIHYYTIDCYYIVTLAFINSQRRNSIRLREP